MLLGFVIIAAFAAITTEWWCLLGIILGAYIIFWPTVKKHYLPTLNITIILLLIVCVFLTDAKLARILEVITKRIPPPSTSGVQEKEKPEKSVDPLSNRNIRNQEDVVNLMIDYAHQQPSGTVLTQYPDYIVRHIEKHNMTWLKKVIACKNTQDTKGIEITDSKGSLWCWYRGDTQWTPK